MAEKARTGITRGIGGPRHHASKAVRPIAQRQALQIAHAQIRVAGEVGGDQLLLYRLSDNLLPQEGSQDDRTLAMPDEHDAPPMIVVLEVIAPGRPDIALGDGAHRIERLLEPRGRLFGALRDEPRQSRDAQLVVCGGEDPTDFAQARGLRADLSITHASGLSPA